MDESPYRAPRGEGATLSRPFQFSLPRLILAIAQVGPGICFLYCISQIVSGAWPIYTQEPVVIFGAMLGVPVTGASFGSALAVIMNWPTRRWCWAVAVGGTVASLVAFGAWVFTR